MSEATEKFETPSSASSFREPQTGIKSSNESDRDAVASPSETKFETESKAARNAACTSVPSRIRSRRKRVALALKDWERVPSYLRDNEYIKNYYRVDYTFAQTLRSLFTIHNETGSVWTHLVGVIIFIVLTVVTIAARPAPLRLAGEHLNSLEGRIVHSASDLWRVGRNLQSSLRGAGGQIEQQLWLARQQIESMLSAAGREGASALRELEGRLRGISDLDLLAWEHWLMEHRSKNMKMLETAISQGLASVVDLQWPSKRWPIHVFTAGAMVCLATSTICHLFGSVGPRQAQNIWRFDYAGIVVLIVTSFVPVVYYSFLCNPVCQYFYLISTVALGSVTAAVSLMKTFQSVKYRTFRAGLFATLGLWGVVPGLHALILYGRAYQMRSAFILDVCMGLVYLGGAALYAARIPERWKPGAFDLMFNSHQLFHCAVVIAALLHYWGVRILLNWRDTTGGCTVPFKDLMATQLQNGTKL